MITLPWLRQFEAWRRELEARLDPRPDGIERIPLDFKLDSRSKYRAASFFPPREHRNRRAQIRITEFLFPGEVRAVFEAQFAQFAAWVAGRPEAPVPTPAATDTNRPDFAWRHPAYRIQLWSVQSPPASPPPLSLEIQPLAELVQKEVA